MEIDPAFDPCNCCTTSAAYGADGKLAVLYREETDNQRDMYLVLWDQEQNKASRTRISSTLWTDRFLPDELLLGDPRARRLRGGLADEGQIYFARLDGKGAPQSPAEIKTPGTTGMRTGMLTLSRGRQHVGGLEERRPTRLATLRPARPPSGSSRLRPQRRQRRGGRSDEERPVCALPISVS